MATINYCSDGRIYLEVSQADMEAALYTPAPRRMDIEISHDDAKDLADAAIVAVDEYEEANRGTEN